MSHVGKYVGSFMSDRWSCSCGWKGAGYWDFPEAAHDEWLIHMHDVGAPVSAENQARQKIAVRLAGGRR